MFPEWARYCASILGPLFSVGGWGWLHFWRVGGGPTVPSNIQGRTRMAFFTVMWHLAPPGAVTDTLWALAMAFIRAAVEPWEALASLARLWRDYHEALAQGFVVNWAAWPRPLRHEFVFRDVDAEAAFDVELAEAWARWDTPRV